MGKVLTGAQVKAVLNSKDVWPDKVWRRAAVGRPEYLARWFYYYHNGKSIDQKMDEVEKAGFELVAGASRDVWQSWPKDSYFEVVFKERGV